MKPLYPKLKDYEGFEFDSKDQIIRFACCDCGLIHDMKIAVIGKRGFELVRRVEIAFKRFNRGTAQLRRHQYGTLQQQAINGWRMRRDK